ncbi:MAG: ParA family protein [Oscillospiraceae bacterium]|jgi:chromosome partitioning protein|nr:ParA family protein [Oscillospiraceae bacterium]
MRKTKIIVFCNQKGGVGKTSICAGVAGCLNALGKVVLAIDLDPQGNLGYSLGADMEHPYSTHTALTGKVDLYDAVQHTDTCDCVISDLELSNAENEIGNAIGREMILKEQLDHFAYEYDYVLLDTPPAINLLTINAFTAADWVIVPMLPEVLCMLGVRQLFETVGMVNEHYNRRLEVRGIVLNKYNHRLKLTTEMKELAELAANQYGAEVFKTTITQGIAIAEAPAHGMTIYDYAPKSTAASEMMQLTYEIVGAPSSIPKRPLSKKGFKLKR